MIKKACRMLRRQGLRAFSHLVREKLNNRMLNHEKYHHWIAQYEGTMVRGEDSAEWLTALRVNDTLPMRLEKVQTEWVLFHLEGVDVSKKFAWVVRGFLERHPDKKFWYTDGDLKVDGVRKKPSFKADWSPDTYLCHDYVGGIVLVRTALAKQVAGEMQARYRHGWLYDFGLRATELLEDTEIGHVPYVMYHRTKPSKPVEASYLVEMKEQAIARREAKLRAEGLLKTKGRVELRQKNRVAAVVYEPLPVEDGHLPLVSIIIPSKDNPELLRTCMESVEKYTTYDAVQWIVVDNGGTEEHQAAYRELFAELKFPCEYVVEKKAFNFSYMCNVGARHASGNLLVFLNDDMELPPSSGDWLERMVGQALQPHTGAVGAKLLYPNSTMIQHLGVVNYTTGAAHLLWQKDDQKVQTFWRNVTEHNYSVVTGACICVEKEKFWRVGGFEEKLAVTFNDVALCFALLRAGYYQVVRSDVMLYHHESITRGNDHLDPTKVIRNLKERELLFDLFPEYVGIDPFYSKHLSQKRLDHTLDYVNRPKLCSLHTVKCPAEASDEEIHYRVERITVEAEVTIEGWAYAVGRRAGKCRQLILEGENGEVLAVDAQPVYTPTLNDLMQTEQNLYFAGFASRFSAEELEEDVAYRIWVDCGGVYRKTKATVKV